MHLLNHDTAAPPRRPAGASPRRRVRRPAAATIALVATGVVAGGLVGPATAAPGPAVSTATAMVDASYAASANRTSTVRTVIVNRYVPFRTVSRTTDTLVRGTTRVRVTGVRGVIRVAYREVVRSGRVVSRTFVAQRTLRPARTRVVLVGTAASPRAARSAQRLATARRLNWPAVAWCESRNIPTIVDSTGQFYGLYQFRPSTWRAVGGRGMPHRASREEQTYRAQLLWVREGARPWPVCGRRL